MLGSTLFFGGGSFETTVNLMQTSNVNNVNLFTAFGSPTTKGTYTYTVDYNVYIGSTSTNSPCIVVPNNFPAGSIVKIINHGHIWAKGGDGGDGGYWPGGPSSGGSTSGGGIQAPKPWASHPPTAGLPAGNCIETHRDLIYWTADGELFSGGDGGDGGEAFIYQQGWTTYHSSGYGGGGGQSFGTSLGGSSNGIKTGNDGNSSGPGAAAGSPNRGLSEAGKLFGSRYCIKRNGFSVQVIGSLEFVYGNIND